MQSSRVPIVIVSTLTALMRAFVRVHFKTVSAMQAMLVPAIVLVLSAESNAGTYAFASAMINLHGEQHEFPEGIGFAAFASATGTQTLGDVFFGTADASAFVSNRALKLEATADSKLTLGSAYATAHWTDTLRATAAPGHVIPDTIYAHVHADGLVSNFPSDNNANITAAANVSFLGRSYDVAARSHESNVLNVDIVIPITTFDNQTFLDGVTRSTALFSWSMSGTVEVDVTGKGFGGADFGDTIQVTRVTMSETGDEIPEDFGISLQFESGFPGPNSVPEPTSLALTAIALTCIVGRRALRRRYTQLLIPFPLAARTKPRQVQSQNSRDLPRPTPHVHKFQMFMANLRARDHTRSTQPDRASRFCHGTVRSIRAGRNVR